MVNPGPMHTLKALLSWSCLLGLSTAACPFADPASAVHARQATPEKPSSKEFLEQYEVDDSKGFLTSDVGGPIEDQTSLKAGVRGSTLLEDFIFRQKIQHFDHERVRSCV